MRPKTCLLLGAGASKHLRFPLGNELQRKMIERLQNPKELLDNLPSGVTGVNAEFLQSFHDELAFGPWYSPDQFLADRRRYAEYGKYLLMRILSEYEKPNEIAINPGWYTHLRDAIHCLHWKVLDKCNFSIVTFNYDRSIDYFLHKYVQHTFCIPPADAIEVVRNAIPIVHVHGLLADYPEVGYGQAHLMQSMNTSAIKVIYEVNGTSPEFELASRLLNEAEKVIVFGFGFHEDNVNRLKFFKKQEKETRKIIVAAGSRRGAPDIQAVNEKLQRFGLQEQLHYRHTNCNDFFDGEFNPFR